MRELEAQNSIRAEPVVAPPVTVPQQRTLEPMISPVSREPQVPRTLLPCQSCGRENPSSQRFCGMCGTLLPEAEQASPLQREQWHAADLHIQDQHIYDQHVEDFPREESVRFQEEESQFAPPELDHRDLYERQRQRSNTNELSLFQTGREVDYRYDDSGEIMDAPSSGSYRIYIGLGLGNDYWRSSVHGVAKRASRATGFESRAARSGRGCEGASNACLISDNLRENKYAGSNARHQQPTGRGNGRACARRRTHTRCRTNSTRTRS